MNSSVYTFSLRAMVVGIGMLALPCQSAPDFVYQKLLGKWTGTAAGNRLGSSCAASDQWFALGANEADEQSANQGAVQLFSPTGAFVRKLLPPSMALNQKFGTSVEISGDLIVVGAPATGAPGKVYVFNTKTGAVLRTLTPSISANDDQFGISLSVEGDVLAVGATGGTQRVWLFKLSTGQELSSAVPSDPQANALFGYSMDLQGGLLLVGAPFYDNGGNDRGAVYWYNISNPAVPQFLARTLIAGTDASDLCGVVVRLHQSFGVVACPGMVAGAGRIIVLDPRADITAPTVVKTLSLSGSSSLGSHMDVSDGTIICSDINSDLTTFDISGTSVAPLRTFDTPGFEQVNSLALCGNTLLIGTEGDETQGNFAGAGIVIRSITRPLPLSKIAGKGDFAPGVVEANFASFSDVRINNNGNIALAGGLSGPGSGSGKDLGIWETLGGTPLTLAGKSRLTIDAASVATVSAPLIKASETLIAPATTIPATTIFRAKINGAVPAIFRDDGTSVKLAFAAGSFVGGGELLSFGQVSVPAVDNSLAFLCKFKLGSGTTAANDSAAVWHRFQHNSAPPIATETSAVREGDASGFAAEPGETSAPKLGEVNTHLTYTGSQLYYANLLTGPADKNQGLFRRNSISASPTALFRKGVDSITDANGNDLFVFYYGSFLGLSSNSANDIVFRSLVTGPFPTVTKPAGEGLWSGQPRQLLAKGEFLPGSSTAKINGFKAFWATGGGNYLTLVSLTGTGVSAINDQAVVLMQTVAPVNGVDVVLMREGDPAPGLNPAKIGVIQQVDVDPTNGQYLILASLAGAPVGKDLALFHGHASAPLATSGQQPLRLPYPILRKGILFDDQPSKLKSFSLPANNRNASGAGNVGLGSVIQGSSPTDSPSMISTLIFDNGVTQVGVGTP